MKRVAKVIIMKNNKFLLQLRDNKPNLYLPNTWTLFGGKIENDETPIKTAKREILEEIGIKLNEIRLLKIVKNIQNNQKVEHNIFIANTNDEPQFLTEGQEAKFFSKEELNSINIMPLYKKMIMNLNFQ